MGQWIDAALMELSADATWPAEETVSRWVRGVCGPRTDIPIAPTPSEALCADRSVTGRGPWLDRSP